MLKLLNNEVINKDLIKRSLVAKRSDYLNDLKVDNLEWHSDVKRNPPPEGVMVHIRGTDYMGEWIAVAMRKDYIKPPPGTGKKRARKAFRKGWRWCYKSGEKLSDQFVDSWSFIPESSILPL